jgi:hypothetical protein
LSCECWYLNTEKMYLYHVAYIFVPNVVGKWLTLLLCIQEAPG